MLLSGFSLKPSSKPAPSLNLYFCFCFPQLVKGRKRRVPRRCSLATEGIIQVGERNSRWEQSILKEWQLVVPEFLKWSCRYSQHLQVLCCLWMTSCSAGAVPGTSSCIPSQNSGSLPLLPRWQHWENGGCMLEGIYSDVTQLLKGELSPWEAVVMTQLVPGIHVGYLHWGPGSGLQSWPGPSHCRFLRAELVIKACTYCLSPMKRQWHVTH